MLEEFKSYHHFVEKRKLANNLYVENLNSLSWNKSPTNYSQDKKTIVSNFNYSLMLGEFLKSLIACCNKLHAESQTWHDNIFTNITPKLSAA